MMININDQLSVTQVDGVVKEITHSEGFDTSFWIVHKDELRKKLIDEVNGIKTDLWSDNEYDEASSRGFLVTYGGEIITKFCGIGYLILLINDSRSLKFFHVNIEDNLI